MTVTIGSLCTGYGGLDMAVTSVLDAEVVWHADPDPGASAILAHHWPTVPNLGDIKIVDWAKVTPVDLVTGGYPCQPFSIAGQMKGTADDRHIWPYIATALGVLRPRLAVFENVANHLRLGFADVLADLARLGFDASWCRVRASEVGAPHQRERLFVIAWPTDTEGSGQPGPRLRGRPAERGAGTADPTCLGRERGGPARGRRPGPADGGVAAADTSGERRGTRRTEPAGQQRGLGAAGGGAQAPADTDRDALWQQPEQQPGSNGAAIAGRTRLEAPADADWGVYGPAVQRWAAVHGAPAPRPTDDHARLSPHFVEWLMGLPAGHVTGVPGLTRTAQLHALGNGVVPAQAAAAIRLLLNRATEVAA